MKEHLTERSSVITETSMSTVPVPSRREREQASPLQPMPRPVRALGAGLAGGGPRPLGVLQGPTRGAGKTLRELSTEEQQELRRKINSRERKRMQDLNVAMDALREVMVPYSSSSSSPSALASGGGQHPQHPQQLQQHPYLQGSQASGGPQAGRRLSKISTLVLARNYILLLASSLQEMRRLLGELSVGVNGGGGVPRVLLAGGWPLLAGGPTGQLLLAPESLLAPPLQMSPSAPGSSAPGGGGCVGLKWWSSGRGGGWSSVPLWSVQGPQDGPLYTGAAVPKVRALVPPGKADLLGHFHYYSLN